MKKNKNIWRLVLCVMHIFAVSTAYSCQNDWVEAEDMSIPLVKKDDFNHALEQYFLIKNSDGSLFELLVHLYKNHLCKLLPTGLDDCSIEVKNEQLYQLHKKVVEWYTFMTYLHQFFENKDPKMGVVSKKIASLYQKIMGINEHFTLQDPIVTIDQDKMFCHNKTTLTHNEKFLIAGDSSYQNKPIILYDYSTRDVKATFSDFFSYVYMQQPNVLIVYDNDSLNEQFLICDPQDKTGDDMTFHGAYLESVIKSNDERWCVFLFKSIHDSLHFILLWDTTKNFDTAKKFHCLNCEQCVFNIESNCLVIKKKRADKSCWVDILACNSSGRWSYVVCSHDIGNIDSIHPMNDNIFLFQSSATSNSALFKIDVEKGDHCLSKIETSVFRNTKVCSLTNKLIVLKCSNAQENVLDIIDHTGRIIYEIKDRVSGRVEISPYGKYCAWRGSDDDLHVLNIEKKRFFSTPSSIYSKIKFNNDESLLIHYCPVLGNCFLHDVNTGQQLLEIKQDSSCEYGFGKDHRSLIDHSRGIKYQFIPDDIHIPVGKPASLIELLQVEHSPKPKCYLSLLDKLSS